MILQEEVGLGLPPSPRSRISPMDCEIEQVLEDDIKRSEMMHSRRYLLPPNISVVLIYCQAAVHSGRIRGIFARRLITVAQVAKSGRSMEGPSCIQRLDAPNSRIGAWPLIK